MNSELEREALLHKLDMAMTASCRCNAKTHEHQHHDEACLYRVLCEARDALSTEAQPEVTGAVAWQFYSDGKWHNGMDTNNHRQNTIDAGYPVRDLYPPSAIQAAVREKLEEAATMVAERKTINWLEAAALAKDIRALMESPHTSVEAPAN